MNKVLVASLVSLIAISGNFAMAKAKVSKEEMKSIRAACKEENPGAKKADIKKCVKEKVKAKSEEQK